MAVGFHTLLPSISLALPLKYLAAPVRNPEAPPWGELKYTPFNLERPDESFPAKWPPPEPIEWIFQSFSKEQVETFLANTDLKPEHKLLLINTNWWKALPDGWRVSPPIEVVRDMSMGARKAIYSMLRQNPQNAFLQDPSRFRPERFESWLKECGLPAEKQELVRKLAIYEEDSVYFYDALLMEWLCTDAERKSLGKALSQTPSLLMKLHITPESDVDRLVSYWGRAGRGQIMKPLIESLDDISAGVNLNVSFFFPTFARMRLYTYPDLKKEGWVGQEDCFWTALNFFNETPDYKLMQRKELLAKLKAEYVEVNRDFLFGDVMALIDGEKQVVHMCVYIADDVVFTKNGSSPLSPWVLMRQRDMMKDYAQGEPIRTRVFRKKSLPGAGNKLAGIK